MVAQVVEAKVLTHTMMPLAGCVRTVITDLCSLHPRYPTTLSRFPASQDARGYDFRERTKGELPRRIDRAGT